MDKNEYRFRASLNVKDMNRDINSFTEKEIKKFTPYQKKLFDALLCERYLYSHGMTLPGDKLFDT
jgi:hypothetical protein